jgi:hypothetical protein
MTMKRFYVWVIQSLRGSISYRKGSLRAVKVNIREIRDSYDLNSYCEN